MGVLDEGDGLHQVGYGDDVVGYGDVDRCGGRAV